MPSRRAFIHSGIAVSAIAASPFTVRAASVAPSKALFERNLADGAAFGATAARHGIETLPITGELGSVWMNGLEQQLRSMPMVIAGLTSGGPLFCLELLGRDYGLRPVYRIEHRRLADGRVEHIAHHAPSTGIGTDVLSQAGDRWPTTAAELALSSLRRPFACNDLSLIDLAGPNDRERRSTYTWVLTTDTSRKAILTRY